MRQLQERNGRMFNGINVVHIAVPDLDAARAFYGETLQLGPPVHDLPDDGWIEFSAGDSGARIAVTTTEQASADAQTVTIVFNVSDCRTAVEWLRARGVPCGDPVTFPGYVIYATFHDPFGNRLQICSPA